MKKAQIFTLLIVGSVLISLNSCHKKTTKLPDLTEEQIKPEENTAEEVSKQNDEDVFEMDSKKEESLVPEFDPSNLDFEPIYFEYDQSDLTIRAREILAGHAGQMQKYKSVKLLIEGHCDERGTIEYNLALGERRALMAQKYLLDFGISPGRVATISYGKERPVDYRHAEDAWAKNRRANFIITTR